MSAYRWDFGDGSPSGSGPRPSHPYSDTGTYTVTLTVSDAAGFTATTSQEITVQAPPIACFSVVTAPADAGQPVGFDGSASSPTGSISSYSWDFGDGSPAGGGATPSHTYAARAGQLGALLTVVLSGPGRLSVGSTTVMVHRPQRVIFRVRASGRQLAQLQRRHALTMHVRVEFVPQSGTTTRRTATIRLH